MKSNDLMYRFARFNETEIETKIAKTQYAEHYIDQIGKFVVLCINNSHLSRLVCLNLVELGSLLFIILKISIWNRRVQ